VLNINFLMYQGKGGEGSVKFHKGREQLDKGFGAGREGGIGKQNGERNSISPPREGAFSAFWGVVTSSNHRIRIESTVLRGERIRKKRRARVSRAGDFGSWWKSQGGQQGGGD